MTIEHVSAWATAYELNPIQVDCAVTVMLKILDGKCKMPEHEKVIMTLLYDRIKMRKGQILNNELHALIAQARVQPTDETLKMQVYEQRLLAETALTRPVMKKFKAYIREHGLLAVTESDDDS
ncbi:MULTISPECIES: hypothetical protein [Methylomonas]|uniref:hypothetical protein n=1 Tax=Methylomonas TaxID=416 RepID=UPI001232D0EC|nr:hypothetical protein [Methylomonas rhizoryzae]